MQKYVWYAGYGSNINRERFLKYLIGGKAEGAKIEEIGAIDKAVPIKEKNIILRHKLFFAENSKRWNGGVAFINYRYEPNVKTFGKMYLIKFEQFKEVFCQENRLPLESPKWEMVEELTQHRSAVIADGKYGRVLCLGESEKFPILTFTMTKEIEEMRLNKPSKEYIQVIAKGIEEAFNLSDDELKKYFNQNFSC